MDGFSGEEDDEDLDEAFEMAGGYVSTACWFAASVLERCADDLLQLVLLGMETRACPYDPLYSHLPDA